MLGRLNSSTFADNMLFLAFPWFFSENVLDGTDWVALSVPWSSSSILGEYASKSTDSTSLRVGEIGWSELLVEREDFAKTPTDVFALCTFGDRLSKTGVSSASMGRESRVSAQYGYGFGFSGRLGVELIFGADTTSSEIVAEISVGISGFSLDCLDDVWDDWPRRNPNILVSISSSVSPSNVVLSPSSVSAPPAGSVSYSSVSWARSDPVS